jgi:hypothetical protein
MLGGGDLVMSFPDLRRVEVAEPMHPAPMNSGPLAAEEPLSDADYAAMLTAEIVDAYTIGSLANVAHGQGHHAFMGSVSGLTTAMDLYFNGSYVVHTSDEDEYEETVMDWLSQATGYCSSYPQLVEGEILICPHELDTDLQTVQLGDNCGHTAQLASVHTANMKVKGFVWSQDSENTNKSLSQGACQNPPPPPDGGGGGGGGPPPFCDIYTCLTWYYVDTGETIATYCWCSS